MTKRKEDIIQEINQEQQKLKGQLKITNPEINKLKEYLKKTDFSNLKTYHEIDIKDFMINYTLSINSNYNREELTKLIESIIPTINIMSTDDIDKFIHIGILSDEQSYNMLLDSADKLSVEQVKMLTEIKNLQDNDFFQSYEIIKKYLDTWGRFYYINSPIESLVEEIEKTTNIQRKRKKFVKILEEVKSRTDLINKFAMEQMLFHMPPLDGILNIVSDYQKYPNTFKEVLDKVYIIKSFQIMSFDSTNNKIAELRQANKDTINIDILEEETKKEFNKNKSDLMSVKSSIINHIKILEEKDKERHITAKFNITKYDRLKKALTEEDEITNYRMLIDHIKNKNLRIDILNYIYERNNREYENLKEKYQTLVQEPIVKYKLLMKQYKLDKIEVDILMKNYSYQELKDTLNSITKITTDEKIISSIIKVTNQKTAKEIENLINNNVLSLDVAQNTTEIWDRKKDYPTTIKENKKVIEDITSSDDLYKKRNQVLLIPTDKLQTNLKKLDEYLLLPSLSTTTNYQFLGYDNLEEAIDLALELGKEQDIVDNIGLLNYDINRWYRLNILNQLNIPVEKDQLEGVLHTDNFLVPDNKISEYLDYNFVINQDIEIPEDEVTETKRTYLYQGIHFSKMKAERNLKETLSNNQQPIITELLIKDRMFSENEKSILKENASYSK